MTKTPAAPHYQSDPYKFEVTGLSHRFSFEFL